MGDLAEDSRDEIEQRLHTSSSLAEDQPTNSILQQFQDRLQEEVDPSLREKALRYASRIIVRLANSWTEKEVPKRGPARPVRDPRLICDELEMDWTVERLVENPLGPPEENLVVLERRPEELACVLFVDHSYSMKGLKLIMAALAGATLALHLRETYGVVAFNTSAKLLKPLDLPRLPRQVVEDLLRLPALGFTNVRGALELGLNELRGFKKKLGVLVRDGDWTCSGNPLELAASFDRLHVIAFSDDGLRRPGSKVIGSGRKGEGHLCCGAQRRRNPCGHHGLSAGLRPWPNNTGDGP